MKSLLELKATEVYTEEGDRHQCLAIVATNIHPSCLKSLQLPGELILSRGVVLWGSAPHWLNARLIELCRPAPWIGCYNVLSGSVVIIASSAANFAAGDRFNLIPKPPCPAILICGPPNSGKSVFAHALDLTLQNLGLTNAIHLHRAQWDGEGDWFAEMRNREMAKSLRERHKARPSDPGKFFSRHGDAIGSIRAAMDLVLVDFGGMPKAEDVIFLRRCTHYIIISRCPEEIPTWHKFCRDQGKLETLAVIHSVLDDRLEVIKTDPHLEIVAGPWQRNKTLHVPGVLLDEVVKLLPGQP